MLRPFSPSSRSVSVLAKKIPSNLTKTAYPLLPIENILNCLPYLNDVDIWYKIPSPPLDYVTPTKILAFSHFPSSIFYFYFYFLTFHSRI